MTATPDHEQAERLMEARRIVLRHDSQFYGPMKGTRCGCDFCVWPRHYVALAAQLKLVSDELAQAEEREKDTQAALSVEVEWRKEAQARLAQAERVARTERDLTEVAERERDKAQDRLAQAERERDEARQAVLDIETAGKSW